MRGLAARPIVCVVVALCVAGLTLVVLMRGAQADAKPCSKRRMVKGRLATRSWSKHPAANSAHARHPLAAPKAEVSTHGDGVASLSDQDEVAGPT
jgi:hypothetical protein